MTLDDMAHALRGIPRDAVMLIDTADGAKPLLSMRVALGSRRLNGETEALASGASVTSAPIYAMILSTHKLRGTPTMSEPEFRAVIDQPIPSGRDAALDDESMLSVLTDIVDALREGLS